MESLSDTWKAVSGVRSRGEPPSASKSGQVLLHSEASLCRVSRNFERDWVPGPLEGLRLTGIGAAR